MVAMKVSAAEIVIPAGDIRGNPRPRSVAQWVPHEDRHWWTEEALADKSGLRADRTTGRFIGREVDGWRFRVFTDAERSSLILNRNGRAPAV